MELLFSPNSGEDQKKVFTKNGTRRVARNSQWGGLIFGSGGGASSRRRPIGAGGEDPSRRKHGGLGAEPPALKKFAFFFKNSLILEQF